jgi:hypothetical protein
MHLCVECGAKIFVGYQKLCVDCFWQEQRELVRQHCLDYEKVMGDLIKEIELHLKENRKKLKRID